MQDYRPDGAPDAVVGDLPVGELQRLEILKALVPRRPHPDPRRADRGADAAGNRPAVRHVLRRCKERGTTIILITHKLKEVMSLCDRVTVMRAVPSRETRARLRVERGAKQLAESMVGRKVTLGRPRAHRACRRGSLQAGGLSLRDAQRRARADENVA
jgi:ABC-type uncharacterized transport system ATPase subunit